MRGDPRIPASTYTSARSRTAFSMRRVMPDLDSGRTALDRMTRTMYFAIGIATIIFGVLLSRGDSGFLGQRAVLDAPFLWFSVFISLVLPGTFVVLGRVLPLTVMRGLATA